MSATMRHDRSRRIVHIEAPGCIVNVHYGLRDSAGRSVTSVQVKADEYVGESWSIEGDGRTRGAGVRVVQDAAQE